MLDVINLHKTYRQGKVSVHAVADVSFQAAAGEFVAVTGPSGSGKSTVLNLVGGLDLPTSGDVRIEERSIVDLSDAERTKLRRTRIGFVFQFFNLLPTMTAMDNVMLPLVLSRRDRSEARARAEQMLTLVGMAHRLRHRPDELSGGEQQRVAIARALVIDPAIILADEPTGNLDSESSGRVMETLSSLTRDLRKTVVLVTHDPACWGWADRILHFVDGRIRNIQENEAPRGGRA